MNTEDFVSSSTFPSSIGSGLLVLDAMHHHLCAGSEQAVPDYERGSALVDTIQIKI